MAMQQRRVSPYGEISLIGLENAEFRLGKNVTINAFPTPNDFWDPKIHAGQK